MDHGTNKCLNNGLQHCVDTLPVILVLLDVVLNLFLDLHLLLILPVKLLRLGLELCLDVTLPPAERVLLVAYILN